MVQRTLIRGGTVVTNDRSVGEVVGGDVLLEGTSVLHAGPSLGAVEDSELIDANGMIVMPGFVDSHRHTWQSLVRSAAADWTLAQYYTGMRIVMGRLYSPDDMHLGNYLGALECLNAGITTLYDWSHNNNTPDHADEAIRGLRDAGIRAVWGYGNANDDWIPPSRNKTNLPDVRRVREQLLGTDDQLVTMAFAARGPGVTTLDITEEEFRLARDLGLRVTVHVGFGPWCTDSVQQLDSRGLLGPDITFVHCNTLTDQDIALLVDCGASSSISPESELNMGMGDLPTMRFLALGHRPSLSVDVVSSAPGDMFTVMRTLLTTARADMARVALKQGRELDPIPLTTRDVFEFATIEGAKACGFGDRIGSLAPGKQADIVMLDTLAPNMMPLNYSYGAIVEGAHPGNVDTVFVAGRALKRHGALVGVDMGNLSRRVNEARNALFDRAGLPPHQHWMPTPHLRSVAVAEAEF